MNARISRSAQPLRLQAGFTLIELVMVIVILSVLAAVAIPKFVDMGGDARSAAANSVAGSLSSASAINYAARKANSTSGVAVANCTDVSSLLQGGLPANYTITAAAVANNNTATCTLTYSNGGNTLTVNFQAMGIS